MHGLCKLIIQWKLNYQIWMRNPKVSCQLKIQLYQIVT